jgi:hypothetical protein
MEVPFEGGGVLRVDGGAVEITPAIRVPVASLTEYSVETPRKRFGRKGDDGTVEVELRYVTPANQKAKAKLTCALTPAQGQALAAELDRARQVPAESVAMPPFEPCPPGEVLRVDGHRGPIVFDGDVLAIPGSMSDKRIQPNQILALGIDPPRGDAGKLGFWVDSSDATGRGVVACEVSAADGAELARLVSAVEAARPAATR